MLGKSELVIMAATSLDGFLAKDDNVDWLNALDMPEGAFDYQAFVSTIDVVVMGRKSYEVTKGFGELYPTKKVVVLSRSLPTVPEEHIKVINIESVKDLQDALGPDKQRVWIQGGGDVFGQLLEADVVDDIMIFIQPVAIGRGQSMFSGLKGELYLELTEHVLHTNGSMMLRYKG